MKKKVYLGLTDIDNKTDLTFSAYTTSVLPENYDEYAWIGIECHSGIETCKNKNLSYKVIPSFIPTKVDMVNGNKLLDSLETRLIEDLGNVLNDYHKISLSFVQWRLIIGRWVQNYIESMYIKYLKLKHLYNEIANDDCNYYICGSYVNPLAIDRCEYGDSYLIRSDYNLFQYICIISHTKRPDNLFLKIERVEVSPSLNNFSTSKKKLYKKKVIDFYRKVVCTVKRIFCIEDSVVLNNSYLPGVFLYRDVIPFQLGKIMDYTGDYTIEDRKCLYLMDTDVDFRNKTLNYKIRDEFSILIYEDVLKLLPKCYVEGFDYIKKRSDTTYIFANNAKAVFYSCVGIDNEEIFKQYLAKKKNSNTKLCCIQHGGCNGIEQKRGCDMEYSNADFEYTWGWRLNKDSVEKFVPMPGVILMRSYYSKRNFCDDILYVNYIAVRYPIEFLERAFHLEDIVKGEIEFLKKLSPFVMQRIRYRPFHEDCGLNVKERVMNCISGLRIDNFYKFSESLCHCSLVICMEMNTTWIEALRAGKPILLKTNYTEFEEQAIDDIKDLKRIGVLCETWDELARQINLISEDVNMWWNEPERKIVMDRIKNKYAYCPNNGKAIWKRHLLSFLQ